MNQEDGETFARLLKGDFHACGIEFVHGGEDMLIGHRNKHFEDDMASGATPHFQNQMGLPAIEVGAKEFMCIGALPPFDHPHIFIDMGSDTEAVCPYCSTLYKHNPKLRTEDSIPANAAWVHQAA